VSIGAPMSSTHTMTIRAEVSSGGTPSGERFTARLFVARSSQDISVVRIH
jgi:hypothetical protein